MKSTISTLVAALLAAPGLAAAADTAWMAQTRKRLKDGDAKLDAAFGKLLP